MGVSASYFRPENNLFEQEYRRAEIGQVNNAEQQDCHQAIEQHKPFLQNRFSEKELRSRNQQNSKDDWEEQRDQKHGRQFPADQGSLFAARYAQPVNHRIILLNARAAANGMAEQNPCADEVTKQQQGENTCRYADLCHQCAETNIS